MSEAATKRPLRHALETTVGHLGAEVRVYADGGREVVFSFAGRPVDWLNLTVTPETAQQLRLLATLCDGGGDAG